MSPSGWGSGWKSWRREPRGKKAWYSKSPRRIAASTSRMVYRQRRRFSAVARSPVYSLQRTPCQMKSKKRLPDFSRTGMVGGDEGLDREGLLLTLPKPTWHGRPDVYHPAVAPTLEVVLAEPENTLRLEVADGLRLVGDQRAELVQRQMVLCRGGLPRLLVGPLPDDLLHLRDYRLQTPRDIGQAPAHRG